MSKAALEQQSLKQREYAYNVWMCTLINSSQVISQVNITGNGTSMYYLKNWNFKVKVPFHFKIFVKFDVMPINGKRKFADYYVTSDAVSPNLK